MIKAWIVPPTVVNQVEAIQYVLNSLFFIPYGLLYPPWKDDGKQVFVTALVLSLLIEFCQFILNIGWYEVDDVIGNTRGAMIGYGI